MIARTWRGRVAENRGDEYFGYLKETGVKEYTSTPGNRGVFVLRRSVERQVEFLLVTLWDSTEAVRRFAGEDVETAVFYPEDDAFLVDRDLVANHYEVLLGPDAPASG